MIILVRQCIGLRIAAICGWLYLTLNQETLISKGKLQPCHFGVRDGFGSTPLHFAAVRNYKDIVTCLITAGADPFAVNNDGRKPSDLCLDTDIKSMLLAEEAKIIKSKTSKAMRAIKKEQAIATNLARRAQKALLKAASPKKVGFIRTSVK
jgi:ankyrin repeat protein